MPSLRRGVLPSTGLLKALVMLALLASALGAGAAEPAGKVLFATGRADIVSAAGEPRAMERGMAVYPGETLVTGEGRAQLRLADGSSYAIEPFSRFRVDQFRYREGLAADARRAFFSLIKGGFRAITGTVGTEREDNYRVRSQLADIGIRGTVYRAGLVTGVGGVPNRLDVAVTQGTVFLVNEAGILDIPAGQSGFVTGRDILPRLARAAAGAPEPPGPEGVVPDVREGEQYPLEPTPDHHHPPPVPPPQPDYHPPSY